MFVVVIVGICWFWVVALCVVWHCCFLVRGSFSWFCLIWCGLYGVQLSDEIYGVIVLLLISGLFCQCAA